MNHQRQYSWLDQLCLSADQALRAITNNPKTTKRPYPAEMESVSMLSESERKHSAGLMRVNHAGEVCAQALYHGQGLVSKSEAIKNKMQESALEEGDHLAWCHTRLRELGSHTSYLNLFWYMGSFKLGMIAGLIGDKWSLGFLAETENQVVEHLQSHLRKLPRDDKQSQQILQQMKQDEALHRDEAKAAGAHELPLLIKNLMRACSKVMVKTAYWV
jgi:ubiquinone biosynthesis monooxygenase Coq7